MITILTALTTLVIVSLICLIKLFRDQIRDYKSLIDSSINMINKSYAKLLEIHSMSEEENRNALNEIHQSLEAINNHLDYKNEKLKKTL